MFAFYGVRRGFVFLSVSDSVPLGGLLTFTILDQILGIFLEGVLILVEKAKKMIELCFYEYFYDTREKSRSIALLKSNVIFKNKIC